MPLNTQRQLPSATSLALLGALAGPPLFVVIPDRIFGEYPSLSVLAVLQLLYIGLAVFVLWVVVHEERLPLQSIGLRPPDRVTLVSGILLWLVTSFLLPIVTAPIVNAMGTGGLEAGIRKLAVLPAWFRVIVGVSAGFVEEILYRGYAIERLTTISGKRWFAAAISIVAFGLAHVPAWGLGFSLAADFPFGILMTLFYLWRRDLLANILAHGTGLVVALLPTAS
jgi:membrane protease YdiL (CAAX protease family)